MSTRKHTKARTKTGRVFEYVAAAAFAAAGREGGAEGSAAAERARERLRKERAARYAAEALREQREAGRRAEEAYRAARGGAGPKGGAGHAPAGGEARAPGGDTRVYRYQGKVVPNYYEVLEVSTKARQSVIDKAYRTLMKECHPDQGGDSRRAQLLNEAYEVLRDAEARRRFDRENGLG